MFGLSFLNAGILVATIATLIPLLIHLFVKNKPQKVYFSSLKFLREILEESRKKMTLNQIILLILRMLIILFTVFALAKPVVKLPFAIKENYHPPTAVAFILDTSPSMDYVIDQKTQIQHGVDIIKRISSEMTSNDVSLLLTSDNLENSLKSRLVYGLIPEKELHEQSFTWTPEPLNKLIAKAQEELTNSRFLHKEIFVISDMQQAEVSLESDIPISFIPTFTDSIRINISIEKVAVKKEPIVGVLQRIAEFEIVNYSPLYLRDQIVRLSLNGSTASEKMIDLHPYERKTDFFIINSEKLEWNYGHVEVRNERFLPDNRFYFSFYNDPQPSVAIISNLGDIPRPIEVLAEIFLGEYGQLEYIQPENIQLADRYKYHFMIFYLSNFSSRTQALISELKKNDYQCLYILHPSMTDEAREFITKNYQLSTDRYTQTQPEAITAFHQWHRIVGDFQFNTNINLTAKPVFNIKLGRGNSSLINTESTSLFIENKDIFVNIDFNNTAQNLFIHPAFPIILYRSFSWISQYDGVLNNYAIGELFQQRQGNLRSPSGNEYAPQNTGLRFSEPGIWTFTDLSGAISYLAVNMYDFENQSRHNPMTEIRADNISIIELSSSKILGQDKKGNEIWKILLWGALLFLVTEMILIIFFQKKSKI